MPVNPAATDSAVALTQEYQKVSTHFLCADLSDEELEAYLDRVMRPIENALVDSVPTTTNEAIATLETALSLLALLDLRSGNLTATNTPWNGQFAVRLIENALLGLKKNQAARAE